MQTPLNVGKDVNKGMARFAFHAAAGDPANLKRCQRGAWQDRLLVETVLAMLTLVCHCTKVMHRGWAYVQARLACTGAAFTLLVQWHGFQPSMSGLVSLSRADCSLSQTNTIGSILSRTTTAPLEHVQRYTCTITSQYCLLAKMS